MHTVRSFGAKIHCQITRWRSVDYKAGRKITDFVPCTVAQIEIDMAISMRWYPVIARCSSGVFSMAKVPTTGANGRSEEHKAMIALRANSLGILQSVAT